RRYGRRPTTCLLSSSRVGRLVGRRTSLRRLQDAVSTHLEAPSQIRLAPHDVPEATGRCIGVPARHSSVEQGLPSTGRSVLSSTTSLSPAPLHRSPLQSPAV